MKRVLILSEEESIPIWIIPVAGTVAGTAAAAADIVEGSTVVVAVVVVH